MFKPTYETQAVNQIYQGHQQNQTVNQPRELRILERLEGVSGSIQELEAFLFGFKGRLTGEACAVDTKRPPSAGIFDSIVRAEESLRTCREIVRQLDESF